MESLRINLVSKSLPAFTMSTSDRRPDKNGYNIIKCGSSTPLELFQDAKNIGPRRNSVGKHLHTPKFRKRVDEDIINGVNLGNLTVVNHSYHTCDKRRNGFSFSRTRSAPLHLPENTIEKVQVFYLVL